MDEARDRQRRHDRAVGGRERCRLQPRPHGRLLMSTRLYRSRDDRILAGVAGGVAEYFGLDPSLVRIAWALLAFAGGFGVLLYIVMAIVVPEDDYGPDSWTPSPGAGPAGAADPGASPSRPGAGTGPSAAGVAGAPPDWRAQRAADREARRAERRARGDDGGRTASLVIG